MAWMCQEEGAEMVVVHWRTRADLYGGERELHTIAEVKDRLSIPVVANGDVIDAASALDTLARTGCDGLMIGRGAIRDPWVFRRIERALAGLPPLVVDVDDKERVLIGYYRALREVIGYDKATLGRMKKIARYFTEGLVDGRDLRQRIFHSQTVEEAMDEVRAYFDSVRARPATAHPTEPVARAGRGLTAAAPARRP
jgi:tRNA-dihydrouridine synthase B